MTITNEVESLAAFIKLIYPDSQYFNQTPPIAPTPNTFSIRFQKSDRKRETSGHSLLKQEFQVVYYGTDVFDVLEKIDHISRVIDDSSVMIPLLNEEKHMRVVDFVFSEPVKSEDNLDMILAILGVEVREGLTLTPSPLINQFNIKIT